MFPAITASSRAARLGMLSMGGTLVAAGLVVLAAAPASAAATGGVGATLPYVEVQAEDSANNGTVIGPSADYNTLPAEASRRKAVTLQGTGKFVEFTTPVATNSIVSRYSIPDSANGSVYTAPISLLYQRNQAAQHHLDQRVQLVLRRLPVHQLAGEQPTPLLRRGAPAVWHHRVGRHQVPAADRRRGHRVLVHDRLRRLRERRRGAGPAVRFGVGDQQGSRPDRRRRLDRR